MFSNTLMTSFRVVEPYISSSFPQGGPAVSVRECTVLKDEDTVAAGLYCTWVSCGQVKGHSDALGR